MNNSQPHEQDNPSSSEEEPVVGDLGAQIDEASRQQELMDPDAHLNVVDRWINRTAEAIGVITMLIIVATIFVNAIGRYAFNAHLLWAEELVLLALPWLAMTGTFLAVRRSTLIRIDFFFERLPPHLRRHLGMAGYVLCFALFAFLGVISIEFVKLFGTDTSPYLDIATGWSTIALVIGAFAVAAAFLALLLTEITTAFRGNTD